MRHQQLQRSPKALRLGTNLSLRKTNAALEKCQIRQQPSRIKSAKEWARETIFPISKGLSPFSKQPSRQRERIETAKRAGSRRLPSACHQWVRLLPKFLLVGSHPHQNAVIQNSGGECVLGMELNFPAEEQLHESIPLGALKYSVFPIASIVRLRLNGICDDC
ncbi:hypothetical protein HNY73_022462 [Argiope bruennichi]|uniref:Uncharacterized protein n=1 Tax=Argiope bruennichi TaxID=94029 RepID=A0A8T0E200_ARGBR|nr:hypothetical protein HNY73_022462 [Argiope bruennichi]